MQNLHTIRYVTAHYVHLQGLRLVPLGLPFLAAVAWRLGWLPWPPQEGPLAARWLALSFLVALGVGASLGRYYRSHVGSVQPLPTRFPVPLVVVVFLALLTWLAVQEVYAFQWPVSIPLLFVGSVLTVVGWVHGGLRKHYIAIGVALMVFACLGPLGVSRDLRQVLLDLFIAVACIVGGIGDHLVLRRTLRPGVHAYARTV